ncbi:MAG TPA: AarF/UbiB family protein, partial [Thermodesulfobacteriota bacterium]|nr:AarF/UbiB family protein [Thermodesulfobacteriota bacterium]
IKLKDLPEQNHDERKLLAQRGIAATIKQILEDGFFHADPHPGNIMVMQGNVLCFLDWGMVGRLTRESRYTLVDLLQGVTERDSSQVLQALLDVVGDQSPDLDMRALEKDIGFLLDYYYDIPVRKLHVGKLMLEVNSILQHHRIMVPRDLAAMIKTLVTAEGTARRLFADLDVIKEAEPYARKLALERWKPGELLRRMRRQLNYFLALQNKVPKRLGAILGKIDRGELQVSLQHKNLENLQVTLENVANRITVGVITAAMIISSSLIITTGVRPFLFGYPALGILGYAFSAVLGVWLIISIIRNKRL